MAAAVALAAAACCSTEAAAQTFTAYRDSTVAIVAEHGGRVYAMASTAQSGRMAAVEVGLSADGLVMFLQDEPVYQSVRWQVGGSSSSVHLFPYAQGASGEYAASTQFLCTAKSSTSLSLGRTDGGYKFEYQTGYNGWGFNVGKSVYSLALKHTEASTEFMAAPSAYFTTYPDQYTPAHNAGIAAHVFRKMPPAGEYAAICFPQSIRTAERAGAQTFEVTHKVVDKGQVVGFVLRPYSGALSAGRPYLISATTDGATFAAVLHGTAATAPQTRNGLVGTFASAAIPPTCFAVTPQGILPASELSDADAVAAPFTAYIDPSLITATMTPDEASAHLRTNVQHQLVVTTRAPKAPRTLVGSPVYSLAGQRVTPRSSGSTLPRGIYVIHGKKVVR